MINQIIFLAEDLSEDDVYLDSFGVARRVTKWTWVEGNYRVESVRVLDGFDSRVHVWPRDEEFLVLMEDGQ
jgi:hypothetical protein